jgi:tRNA (guanine-N7-)-methyltransferase
MSSAQDVPFVTSSGEAPPKPPGAPAVEAGLESAAAKPGSLIISPKSYFEVLDLQSLFSVAQPLEVELGSGDGSFLVQYAAAHPEHNFLGVERLLGRLRKIDRKGQRAHLRNLRALRVEAGYFLEYMLPPACTRALHIYFPDPWPKRKHRKHRLIGMQFPALAARVLEPKGIIYLRTDDADYFAQMQDVFAAAGQFAPCSTPTALAEVITDFEREFHARGTRTLAAAYELASK